MKVLILTTNSGEAPFLDPPKVVIYIGTDAQMTAVATAFNSQAVDMDVSTAIDEAGTHREAAVLAVVEVEDDVTVGDQLDPVSLVFKKHV